MQLEQIKLATADDDLCKKIIGFCLNGWPKHIDNNLVGYFCECALITFKDDLLRNGNQFPIPAVFHNERLEKLHTGHQGISKRRDRAKKSVWWPGISENIRCLRWQVLILPSCVV